MLYIRLCVRKHTYTIQGVFASGPCDMSTHDSSSGNGWVCPGLQALTAEGQCASAVSTVLCRSVVIVTVVISAPKFLWVVMYAINNHWGEPE